MPSGQRRSREWYFAFFPPDQLIAWVLISYALFASIACEFVGIFETLYDIRWFTVVGFELEGSAGRELFLGLKLAFMAHIACYTNNDKLWEYTSIFSQTSLYALFSTMCLKISLNPAQLQILTLWLVLENV